MGNKGSLYRKGILPFISVAAGIFLLSGCATPPNQQILSDELELPIIESISVSPSQDQTIVEITNNQTTHFTAFQLIDPPRIILDIRGKPGGNLSRISKVGEGNVREINVEKGKTQAMTTRVIVNLDALPHDYKTHSEDKIIRLTLIPKEVSAKAPEKVLIPSETRKAEGPVTASGPRIFFKPQATDLSQILGIDFTMVDRGKSRLILTTDKKIPYHLEQKGPKGLLLNLEKTTIPPLLMRRLESIYFEGAVDRVKASVSDSRVSLDITLREMVPFHVNQTDQGIIIDFGPTSIMPQEKRIVPLQLAQARVQPKPAMPKIPKVPPKPPTTAPAETEAISLFKPSAVPDFMRKEYKGAPMTMDFVNADVTNILRLIAEVSNLNIVWGPDVKGNVSMRLKNVPWDQALELILANNNLDKRRVGNVVWITTKAQMAKIEAEERRKRAEYEAELGKIREAEKKAQEAAKELEPLITEYLPLDFATTSEIKAHIESLLTERGKMSEDARTNTIIITDIAAKIEEAKNIVKQFDTPVKQIMIEARIVDATTTFSRDLGVKWGGLAADEVGINGQRRENTGVDFGIPTDATAYASGSDALIGGTVSSNSPEGWSPNLGFSLGYLTASALGAITLDARIALAESEQTAKIISAPKVIASNGESATIARGTTFYLEAAENVEPKEVTAQLSLEVTPTVSFNNFVTMEVTVKDEKQDVRGKTGKDISTKLMIKTGETIVIGGIYKEDRSEGESGIPWLREIPGLGWLFKAQSTTFEKSELLIFVTPTVLPPPGQTQAKAQAP